ncbi:MAG: type II toxin-antitoxin system HipA family toxin [Hyphomonadaceae bacterium]|nr:type II toxin-antitoxin system HipA family toxin [Hyphomonadaceae bacterium]
MKTALSIWWDGEIAGTLALDEDGNMSFAYSKAWLADHARAALSHSLPKRAESFDRSHTRPFFAGLLPEEAQKEGAARALGLSKGNDFALLDALGGDLAGALTLWPEGDKPPIYDGTTARETLGDNALADILARLPKQPLLAGDDGIRVSLAGAQPKLPIVLVDGGIALPAPGQPSTHILKPATEKLDYATENEAFAMRLASAIGLRVAPVEPRRVADKTFLLVTRYDREQVKDSRYRRLHQEDFCQALSIAPEKKYAKKEGPTFKTSFKLVRDACPRPAPEVLKLLDAALYNLTIGNADAHGKNYSLLYKKSGAELAPLYDLMCTAAYPHVATNLAMMFGEARTLEEVRAKTWPKFAEEAGLGGAFVRRRAGELADMIAGKARPVASGIADQGFNGKELQRLADLVVGRAERVAASVKEPAA